MLTFKSNIANILFRCIGLSIVALCIKPFPYLAIQDPRSNDVLFGYVKKIYLIYIMAVMFLYIIFIGVFALLGIVKVQVDTALNTIAFMSLFKRKTVPVNEIISYFSTIHKNRFTSFRGILLNLKNDQCIQLTEQNIKHVSGLKGYLESQNIAYLGERKMKFPFN